MPSLTLYVAPNTCARAPTIALEEIGVPFDTQLVRLARNEQNAPEYLQINPKGKVPTLLIDGAPLTETPAILTWLAQTYPDAGLLPQRDGLLAATGDLSDLLYFSSTVHPAVTRVAMPARFFPDADAAFELARPMAIEALCGIFADIEKRLTAGPWWYGDTWSVVDGYLFWTWSRVTMIGFPQNPFPNLVRHCEMSLARPAVQRAMAREKEHIALLEEEGCYAPPR